jgi:hypothetical protein
MICLLLLSLAACTNNSYDSGDGTYSLMRADFSDIHVNADKKADYMLTDDGDSLQFSSQITNKYFTIPNTFYRALLYYNKVDGQAETLSLNLLGYFTPSLMSKMKTDSIFTDPVYFESAWKSKNGLYINIAINKLSGKVDSSDGLHVIGLMEDALVHNADGTRTAVVMLFHNQNKVPEYYTTKSYLTLPLSYFRKELLPGDKIKIRVNTYDKGIIEKTFDY